MLKQMCVCVCSLYSRSISTKSPDSSRGNLASLGCHKCEECTKSSTLIPVCFSLSERLKCCYSSAYMAAAAVRFVVILALKVVMKNDGDFVVAILQYYRESTAMTWLIQSTRPFSL